MTEARFAYGRHGTRDAFLVLVFLVAALGWARKASTNDSGLIIIEDVITLSPQGATVFYWAVAGFLLIPALCLGYGRLGDAIVGRRANLELTSESIIVPVFGWSARELTIAYDDILDMSVGECPDMEASSPVRSLTIEHLGGKYTISSNRLPDVESFDTIHEMLAARVTLKPKPVSEPGKTISIRESGFAVHKRRMLRKGRKLVAEVRWDDIDEIAVCWGVMGVADVLFYVFRCRGAWFSIEVNEVMGGFEKLLSELEARYHLAPYLTPEFNVPPVIVWARDGNTQPARPTDAAGRPDGRGDGE